MWVLEAKSSDNLLKLLKQCWWRCGKIRYEQVEGRFW